MVFSHKPRILANNSQAHRLIAQVILIGTQVVGRAFVQAYRQAAANSAAASAHASRTATSRVPGSNLLTKQTGIDVDEACKILNVKKESLILEEVNKVTNP
jgi:mitochondrial import inner membrane translocase subunit TIM16